ncbi:MAG TPA: apolipoprotein N-acyltransferase [Stellaceae bacterium]|nr:apolipoprotein N-acyltransferase [Stellaceae bacterium]
MPEARAGAVLRAAGPLAPLQRAALWLAELDGWRRYLVAALLGVLAAASFSPVDLTPALLFGMTGLVWLADGVETRRAALLLGWSFGFGFFLAGIYWIAAALFVDIDQFWWLLPFAVLALPAGLAIFPALALLVTHEARERLHLSGTPRILVFSAAWCAAEYAQGHLLTGFPWNMLGYAWAGAFPGALAVLQSVSLFGIYGLSLATALMATLPARLGDLDRRRWEAPTAALLILILLGGFGAWRLASALRDMVPGVELRLVQPSIPERIKNDPQARARNFRRLLELSAEPGVPPPTDIIWPEAAAPPLLERYPELRQAMARIIPPGGLLLTGAERAEPLAGWPPQHVWNSLVVLDGKGDIRATFDKSHLVPFGEYVPLRSILPMDKIAPSIGDFSRGPGPRTLDLPGLPPVSPLICYEAMFPGAVIDDAHRPQWLLNITNDAWYGVTSGPFQNLAIARVRAVEEGLPLVRVANNGVSAVFDAYGHVIARLDLNAIGVLDAPLPAALPPTLYEHGRDRLFWGMLLAVLAISAAVSLINRRRRP